MSDSRVDDAAALVSHFQAHGLEPSVPQPGWQHMGAIITDAVLQSGVSYQHTVLPRVRKVRDLWPDAVTVTGFLARLGAVDINEFLQNRHAKLRAIPTIAETLHSEGIEKWQDLHAVYQSSERARAVNSRLRAIKFVGPKTLSYLPGLVGFDGHAAIDVQLRRFAADAGVNARTDSELATLYAEAAQHIGCTTVQFDRAVWDHMSRNRRSRVRTAIQPHT